MNATTYIGNLSIICQHEKIFTKFSTTLRKLKYISRIYCVGAVSFLEKYCSLIPRLLVAILPLKRTCSECGQVVRMRGKQFYSYYESFSVYIDRLVNDYQCYDCYKNEMEEREKAAEELEDVCYYGPCTCDCCSLCLERIENYYGWVEADGIAKVERELAMEGSLLINS